MKLAFVADLHFRGFRLTDISAAWQAALDSMKKEGVSLLLIAGDVFDHYNIASRYASFGTIREAFETPLRKSGIPAVIVEGNHDQAGPGNLGALQGFQSEKVAVAIRPKVIYKEGFAIACLPWITKANLMAKEELKGKSMSEARAIFEDKCRGVLTYLKNDLVKFRNESPSILIGHCMVAGAAPHDGYIMTDGSYMFSQSELESIGTDIIALGDFHKRQGYYVGALTQQSFRDCGNPTGYRLVDVEKGKIKDDKFVHVESPRYYKVKSEDYGKKAEELKGHYVQIIGDIPPMIDLVTPLALPTNHEFRKEVVKKTSTARVKDIDSSESMVSLLHKWHEVAQPGIREEDILQVLNPMLDDLDLREESGAGSLGKIRSVRIQNFGPHKDISIDFNSADLIGICGHNGSGKTFALEAIPACWFGNFPSRNGSIYNDVTNGYLGDASLEVVFEAGGKVYRSLRQCRITGKTKNQEAYLFLVEDGKESALAGPKESDYSQEIQNIVGSKQMFFSSSFAAQNLTGDITEIDPADRQRLLHEMLGLQKFAQIAEVSNAKGKEVNLSLDFNRRQLEQISESPKILQNVEISIVHNTKLLQEAADVVLSLEGDKKREQDLVDQLQESVSKAGVIRAEISGMEQQKRQHNRTIDALKIKREENVKLLESKPELEEKVARIPELEKESVTLNNLISERDALQSTYFNTKANFDNLKNQIQQALWELQKERDSLKKELGKEERKASLLEMAGCHPDYIPCSFINDAKESESVIPRMKAEIERIEILILEEDFAHGERKTLQEIEKELDSIRIPKVDHSRASLLQHELKRLNSLQSQLGAMEAAQKAKDEAEEQTMEVLEQIEILERNLLGKQKELKILEIETRGLPELKNRIQYIEGKIREARNKESEIKTELAVLESRKEELQKKVLEIASLQAEIKALEARVKVFEIITLAFGRSGIPQLLIDSAIPKLQEILDDLLADLDGLFSITFSTQRLTQKGDARETLDIIVTSNRGTMSVDRFSPGEQKLIKLFLRMGTAVFKALHFGAQFKVFFGDEFFDSLDADNAKLVMRLLRSFKEHFNQVIMTSHYDDYLANLPMVIAVKGNGEGTRVEVI